MQAHKNPILNRYVKLIIEKILNWTRNLQFIPVLCLDQKQQS
jgi:hypothetical protein